MRRLVAIFVALPLLSACGDDAEIAKRNMTTVYFVEQMAPVPVNVYHYRRTFKPQTLLPDVDFRGSAKEIIKAVTPD
tara:strand:+ start:3227 stop:3457 length:231 start_codon:yes stop_codon:yes gene_type:complete